MPYLADYTLVDLDETKRYLRVSGTDDDELIADLINDASDEIEKACNTVFIRRTVTEDYSGGISKSELGGAKRIYLKKSPVNSVTSITDDDSDTVSSDDYTIVAPNILEHDTEWPIPDGRWTIIYDAGRYTAITDVDRAIRRVCKTLVADAYSRPNPAVTEKSVGDLRLRWGSSQASDPQERADWIRSQLGSFINWSV